MAIWRCVVCLISKATLSQAHVRFRAPTRPHKTHTHQYVILIAFPLQQWFGERASMLHLYLHCLCGLDSTVYFCLKLLTL
jgi:hypothetical protein